MNIVLLCLFLLGTLIYCQRASENQINGEYVPFRDSYTIGQFLISILTFPYYIFHKILYFSLEKSGLVLEMVLNFEIRKKKNDRE